MDRTVISLRLTTVAAVVIALAFALLPASSPRGAAGGLVIDSMAPAVAVAQTVDADSLAEDVILANVFSSTRSAPSRRIPSGAMTAGESGSGAAEESSGRGFRPVLVGTAVSDRAGETRALLQLDPSDPAPRLYAVGDQAGGYRIVSIEAREVVVTGPGGRIVLRLPQRQEDYS